MDLESIFATAGASAVGAAVGIVLKDYIAVRSLEGWKERRKIEALYRKHCDPIALSAEELANRINEILNRIDENERVEFLDHDVLSFKEEICKNNSDDDPYFMKYKLMSTTYRLCALLGWLELFREEMTYLEKGKSKHDRLVDRHLTEIRSCLADGHLNAHTDWTVWTDCLLFREEQRAIGEAMLVGSGDSRRVIGYGKYCDAYSDSLFAKAPTHFFLDLGRSKKDFRVTRLRYLLVSLVRLIRLLRPNSMSQRLTRANAAAEEWLEKQPKP